MKERLRSLIAGWSTRPRSGTATPVEFELRPRPTLYSEVWVDTSRFADEGVPAGSLGYVIEDHGDEHYEVEVSDPATGTTIAMVVAGADELRPVVRQTLDEALAGSRADGWSNRRTSAEALGTLLPDQQAFARLVDLLDDPNTAVVEVAARHLVARGALGGLAEAAKAYAAGDHSVSNWVGDTIEDLRYRGYPIDDALRELHRHGPDDRRQAVHQLMTDLEIEGSSDARALVELIVSRSGAADRLGAQAATVRVIGGSVTMVELAVDAEPAPEMPDGPLDVAPRVVDAHGASTGELIVWTSDGRISALEFAWWGDDPPTTLPSPAQVVFD